MTPQTDNLHKELAFLQGGGQMGELILAFDWSATPLGVPDTWPLSLKTTLGIALHSAFPQFLFWGPELICFYNDAFRPSLGVEGKHPAIGKKGPEVWPEIWEFVGPLIHQVMTTGQPVWFEDQLVPFYRNGSIENIYWTFSYSPAYGDNGLVNGVFVTCTETTKNVETIQRLTVSEQRYQELVRNVEESEERIRSIVESAPFPIGVYTGKEMRIRFANKAITDVFGKGDDVIGKLYAELLPELESQAIFTQLDDVYTTGIPFHARNQYVEVMFNGTLQPFYFNYSITPLYDAAGNIYGVMNTAADVTDLNLAKQKIEQSEKNFRNMILQAPVAMCILIGPTHIIELANEHMITLWGKPVADVMGKPVFDALPDAREQGLEKLLDDVFNTGITFQAEERPVVLLRNGHLETVYQNFVYEPYRDSDGNIQGVLAVSLDVTNQVIARLKIEDIVAERTKELAEANQSLQNSNAELAQFAYIASHDLQEPLRKVSVFTEMLERNLGDLSDTSQLYVNKIKQSTNRMISLVRDVLSYSELAKQKDTFTTVNLDEIVNDLLVDFELLIEQKNAVIERGVLPVIQAIPLQMNQLFSNLLSNALKFSKQDTAPVITIRSTLVNKDPLLPWYHITLSDNGIGFGKGNVQNIFQIFQRLHGREQYAGNGIGLAMCKKIAHNHHGDIYAESNTPSGAVFHIILPAVPGPDTTMPG